LIQHFMQCCLLFLTLVDVEISDKTTLEFRKKMLP